MNPSGSVDPNHRVYPRVGGDENAWVTDLFATAATGLSPRWAGKPSSYHLDHRIGHGHQHLSEGLSPRGRGNRLGENQHSPHLSRDLIPPRAVATWV